MARPVADSVPLLTSRNNYNGSLKEEYISGLVQGGSWTFGGGPRVISYSFDLNFDGASGKWTTRWINAVERAFDAWESVIDVRFKRVGTPNARPQNESTADIAIALAPGEGEGVVAGFGIFPDPDVADRYLTAAGYSRTEGGRFLVPRPEGDITFDSRIPIFKDLNPGGAGFKVILHEIGHALGLKHTQDRGLNGRPTFSQLDITGYVTPDDLTVMHQGLLKDHRYGTTPMVADIVAIQHIYGANTSYRTGDNLYALDPGDYRTIWDTGGTDTFSAESWRGSGGVTIDLSEGGYSGAREFWRTNLVVGFGVSIENATGSARSDVVDGNRLDNRLRGLGGNDTLRGGGGDDTLSGGTGIDRMYGGDGDDLYILDANEWLTDRGGIDTVKVTFGGTAYLLGADFEHLLLGGAATDGTGNSSSNEITANDADNQLDGAGGDDTLHGGAGADTLVGGAGNDWMYGGEGDDTYFIDSLLDVMFEEGGIDTVHTPFGLTLDDGFEHAILTAGGALDLVGNDSDNSLSGNGFGNNLLEGGLGNDTLDGRGGDDTMHGGDGDDVIYVDSASDVVTGGAGVDTVFVSGFGVAGYDMADDVENATMLTGDGKVTGNDLDNVILGNNSNNVLRGEGGNDYLTPGQFGLDTLMGGAGNDTLTGANGGKLFGGAGDDLFMTDLTNRRFFSLDMSGYPDEWVMGGATSLHMETPVNGSRPGFSVEIYATGVLSVPGTMFMHFPGSRHEIRLQTPGGVPFAEGTYEDAWTFHSVPGGRAWLDVDGGFGTTGSFTVNTFEYSGPSSNWKLVELDVDFQMIDESSGDSIEGSIVVTDDLVLGTRDEIIENDGEGNDTLIANAAASVTGELALAEFHVENVTLTGAGAVGLVGTDGVNILIGNDGANTLDGGAGGDTLMGGGQGDTLVWDSSDALVDGGEGVDTLQVTGDLDLTGIDDGIIVNIEQLDFASDAGANVLTVAATDVLAMSGGTLTILGDSDDSVDIDGDFTAGDVAGDFRVYTVGAATLLIDTDIANVA